MLTDCHWNNWYTVLAKCTASLKFITVISIYRLSMAIPRSMLAPIPFVALSTWEYRDASAVVAQRLCLAINARVIQRLQSALEAAQQAIGMWGHGVIEPRVIVTQTYGGLLLRVSRELCAFHTFLYVYISCWSFACIKHPDLEVQYGARILSHDNCFGTCSLISIGQFCCKFWAVSRGFPSKERQKSKGLHLPSPELKNESRFARSEVLGCFG